MFPENKLPAGFARSLTPQLPDIKSPQEYAFISLVDQIKQFESGLGDGEVVGAMLASFGQSVLIHIHSLSRAGQFFCLEGATEDGSAATLIQHYTQASLLLLKIPKAATEEKRPIGFLQD